jgi:hypothetical protein
VTAVDVYTGLLDEALADDDQVVERPDLFQPPFLDRALSAAARALIVGVLLVVGLLGAIAARGAYGPQAAVAVLWASWCAVLIGLISYALRPAPGRHRKAWL